MTIDLHHFRARVLQDALAEATAGYWLRRARQFDDAAPRPSDWKGSADDQVDRAIRCRQTADNCRHHAQLITEAATIDPDVWAIILQDLG